MSKIYLTGMTSPQASRSYNSKCLSFAGAVATVLEGADHQLTWEDPRISISKEELETYDSIIVGLSPITSLSANRIYGALRIIDLMWGSPKLRLLIDAPGVAQIQVALKAINSNPESLVKEFYSKKKDYTSVLRSKEAKSGILNAIESLLIREWPVTLAPKLPWKEVTASQLKLPAGAFGRLAQINLDAHLITAPVESEDRQEKWAYDLEETPWAKRTIPTLAAPCSPMRVNKGRNDPEVLEQISRSIGTLITPYKVEGSWWTYRYIQSLNTLTPIATAWEESRLIGPEWALLAAGIESMSPDKRSFVSLAQRESYISHIPNKSESTINLEQLLGLR